METTNKTITNIIKELGIPANLSGYHYIRQAVMLMAKDMSLINYITKGLYPAVAKQFSTTASKCERAIRNAIEVGWERGHIDFQQKLFGYTVAQNKGKPTNSEFLCTVSDYLNMIHENSGDDVLRDFRQG